MDLLEHQGKHLLNSAGLQIPSGRLASSASEAADAARDLGGRAVCKAQVPAGKRGKAGAVKIVQSAQEASDFAEGILGSKVGGFTVDTILVEDAVSIERELYAAVLDDADSRSPLVLFSEAGGMDIEEVNATRPESVHRMPVSIHTGLTSDAAHELVSTIGLDNVTTSSIADELVRLYQAYVSVDANLVEVNPLVVTTDGAVMALDAKVVVDPSSVGRQAERLDLLPGGTPPERTTELEARAKELGLPFIELDGDVGVLANGAGLTMTTLDAINHFGGSPANFLEIGGDAYTKATPALELVLSDPKVKSILVNFCGAFARTDVMTGGVVAAIEELRPDIPIIFTIHGTGEEDAIALVRDRLGVEPHDLMDDAVIEAISAARRVAQEDLA